MRDRKREEVEHQKIFDGYGTKSANVICHFPLIFKLYLHYLELPYQQNMFVCVSYWLPSLLNWNKGYAKYYGINFWWTIRFYAPSKPSQIHHLPTNIFPLIGIKIYTRWIVFEWHAVHWMPSLCFRAVWLAW